MLLEVGLEVLAAPGRGGRHGALPLPSEVTAFHRPSVQPTFNVPGLRAAAGNRARYEGLDRLDPDL